MRQLSQRFVSGLKAMLRLDPPLSVIPNDAPQGPLQYRKLPHASVVLRHEEMAQEAEGVLPRLLSSGHYDLYRRLYRVLSLQRRSMRTSEFSEFRFAGLRHELSRIEREISLPDTPAA